MPCYKWERGAASDGEKIKERKKFETHFAKLLT